MLTSIGLRRLALVLGAVPLVLSPSSAMQSAQQAPPKFVAGVDVVELDVSVLDKDHKPVRGLTAADFTIREDSVPQRIVAFDEVYSEPPKPPSAPWIRDVPPDVETNTPAEHNLFVLIMDDALDSYNYHGPIPARWDPGNPKGAADPYVVNKMKVVGRQVVAGLKDDDVASVVFTGDNWKGVSFTSDRVKLRRAVDALDYGGILTIDGQGVGACSALLGSAQALLTTVEALSTVQHRRKTVFYLSLGLDVPIVGPAIDCNEQAQGYVYQAMTLAQRSNVNVYTLDPAGLRAAVGALDRVQLDFLQDTAENTGGRAIINTNEPEKHVAEIFEEARAYYLIGYELSKAAADNLFHRIEVKVNRPSVEVHSRSRRFDAKSEARPDKTPPPLEAAVGGFLPRSDIQLALSSAPFANADGTVRMMLGLSGQLPDPVPGRARDSLGLAVRVFTTDGRAVTSADRTVFVALGSPALASAAAAAKGPVFDTSTEVSLKPGTYSLRIGVHSSASDKAGSVYTDVEVPDFAKPPLSLSGVLMTSMSGGSLRGDALSVLEATAARVFSTDDRMQAFVRVYQGGASGLAGVSMRERIVDEHNAVVLDRPELLPPQAFARDRQADYSIRLPLATLKPGAYLLSIAAEAGGKTATRDVRFTVR